LFWEDADLAACSERARLLFLGLLNLADREGRLVDVAPWIRAKLFPYEPDADIDVALEELAGKRKFSPGSFVTRYEVDGKKFLQVNNFAKYQNPHPRESKSEIPPPPGKDTPSNVKALPGREKALASNANTSEPSSPSEPSEPACTAAPRKRADRESEFAVWWDRETRELKGSNAFWETARETYAGLDFAEVEATWNRLSLYLRQHPAALATRLRAGDLCAWVQSKTRHDMGEALKRAGRKPPSNLAIEAQAARARASPEKPCELDHGKPENRARGEPHNGLVTVWCRNGCGWTKRIAESEREAVKT